MGFCSCLVRVCKRHHTQEDGSHGNAGRPNSSKSPRTGFPSTPLSSLAETRMLARPYDSTVIFRFQCLSCQADHKIQGPNRDRLSHRGLKGSPKPERFRPCVTPLKRVGFPQGGYRQKRQKKPRWHPQRPRNFEILPEPSLRRKSSNNNNHAPKFQDLYKQILPTEEVPGLAFIGRILSTCDIVVSHVQAGLGGGGSRGEGGYEFQELDPRNSIVECK